MDEVRHLIHQELRKVAPERDPSILDPDEPIGDQLDIDSMDWLNFLIGVHKATGVEVAEDDYDTVGTLNALVSFVQSRMKP